MLRIVNGVIWSGLLPLQAGIAHMTWPTHGVFMVQVGMKTPSIVFGMALTNRAALGSALWFITPNKLDMQARRHLSHKRNCSNHLADL
jgi:hypothetical protein